MRRIDKQVKYQMDFEQLNFEIKSLQIKSQG